MSSLHNISFSGNLQEPLYRRFWILSLLSGVEEAGCSPISLGNFNILAYIANAVAQCYGVSALDSTILKELDGPLYPKLIWDLDRLVGGGLVRLHDVVVDSNKKVRHVSYSVTSRGLDCEDSCRSLNDSLAEIGNSLRSAALAYSRNRLLLSKESLLTRDGNYANPIISNGEVVDFGDWVKVNATANSVAQIFENLGIDASVDPAIGVNIYAHYLAKTPKTGLVNE